MRNLMLTKAWLSFFLIGTIGHVSATGHRQGPPTEPQQVTLFSRITYKEQDYGKSAFNFQHGLRSDNEHWLQVTRNYAHLLYGSISINSDTDWFSVSTGSADLSRIKDLGGFQWAEVYSTPFLPAIPRQSLDIRLPGRQESFEASSDGQVTKAVVGHMYLVRIKNREADLYAMFRVETLKPSDECTISWKVMPSPEN